MNTIPNLIPLHDSRPGLRSLSGTARARVTDREAAIGHAHIWNDWIWDYLDGLRNKFVPAAFVPLTVST